MCIDALPHVEMHWLSSMILPDQMTCTNRCPVAEIQEAGSVTSAAGWLADSLMNITKFCWFHRSVCFSYAAAGTQPLCTWVSIT